MKNIVTFCSWWGRIVMAFSFVFWSVLGIKAAEAGEFEMKTVQVSGVSLAYQVYGTGKQDLLFVHGYAVRGSLYEPLFKALGKDFRITALDIRAHGGSASVTQGFVLKQIAQDIVAVVEKLGLNKPVYVGHSLGGLLGLMAELEKPGLFPALVMLNPASADGGKGASPEVIERAIKDHGNKKAMIQHYKSMYVKPVSDAALQAIVEIACLLAPEPHRQYLMEEFPNIDISAQLPQIKAPVLFMNGAKDIVISPEAQHQTAIALPAYKEVILSDEGHMMPLESPERTAKEIISFYENELSLR